MLYQLSYVGNLFLWNACLTAGAGDGSRTRDVQLGRLELYQLSYSRKSLLLVCVKSLVVLVDGEGFEPSKPVATDLQSVPFDRSGTRPIVFGNPASVPKPSRDGLRRAKPDCVHAIVPLFETELAMGLEPATC